MTRYIFSAITLLLLLGLIWISDNTYHVFHDALLKKDVAHSVKIYPKERLADIATRLSSEKIIDNPTFFTWLVELSGNHHRLRYGEYKITPGMTLWDLVQNMARGKGLVQHRITFVNGWTFQDMRRVLKKQTLLKNTLLAASNRQVMEKVSGDDVKAEGWFYPDTYFYHWGHDDLSVLTRSYKKMKRTLANAWKNRSANLPYKTAYQALIAASLIERETGVPSEKRIVASVLVNRLRKNMRLQIDPTVQYGLNKSFGSSITKKDLRTKTPYNTYMKKGLPPTPICMPSRSSIEAALHPAKTNYLFYVATGDGGHNFSATYLEHKEAVKDYRRYEEKMQRNINQMEVWLRDGLTVTGKAVVVITYLPFLENSIGLV